jgi:hypothetical protein
MKNFPSIFRSNREYQRFIDDSLDSASCKPMPARLGLFQLKDDVLDAELMDAAYGHGPWPDYPGNCLYTYRQILEGQADG